MNKNDGGAAFPSGNVPNNAAGVPMGMSLRDYFAGQALQGLLSIERPHPLNLEYTAKIVYQQADAVLKEREKA